MNLKKRTFRLWKQLPRYTKCLECGRASNFEPEDIFDHNDLSRWALNNGFTEEE